jgi:HEAT repeat protein
MRDKLRADRREPIVAGGFYLGSIDTSLDYTRRNVDRAVADSISGNWKAEREWMEAVARSQAEPHEAATAARQALERHDQMLIERLGHEDQYDRAAAVETFADLRPTPQAAVPAIIDAVRDESVPVRLAAVRFVRRLGPEAVEAVPALIEALGAEDLQLQSDAAYALGGIGPAAKQAVPALTEALNNPTLRHAARGALEKINGGP